MPGRKQITDYYGAEVASLAATSRRRLSSTAFAYWRQNGFPFPRYLQSEIRDELRRLQKYDRARLQRTLKRPSMVGLGLANSFHPKIWEAKVRGKSALELFDDDIALRRILEKAPDLCADRKCWSAACVRMLTGLQNRSRVSNFRPTVARAVVSHLTNDGDRVLDFCAGYGGRYLGIATLNRYYFGIDASRHQISGLHRMRQRISEFVPSESDFLHRRAETALKEIDNRSFDLIFTSPPYFRLEKYDSSPHQCCHAYLSYDEWRFGFLLEVIRESRRVLRQGGILALNMANCGPYPVADDCRALCKLVFKKEVKVWRIAMSTNPNAKYHTGQSVKAEPLMIVRK